MLIIFLLSGFGIAWMFFLFPPVLQLWCSLRGLPQPQRKNLTDDELPTVTCIVAVRNAEAFIGDKLANCLALDYPPDKLDFIFYSDGSTDRTAEILREAANDRVQVIEAATHNGKHHGLNQSVPQSNHDLLLFTDADAELPADALRLLTGYLADEAVGGVCGRRVIAREAAELKAGQDHHISYSTKLQLLESRSGSVSSSEGKLYLMRRSLYEPIPEAVTDDLYTCLCVVRQGYRFLYEPAALARIHLPSRSLGHEIARRRRIVSTSLRGIAGNGVLLNPFRYGFYSLQLWTNKVLRRCLPFLLLGALISNLLLLDHLLFQLTMLAQLAFYTLALSHTILSRIRLPVLSKLAATAAYFVIGNIGMMIGVLEFLTGRKTARWEPVKRSA